MEGEMAESFDLQGKLLHYTKDTQGEGKRGNIFLFSSHEIIQILLCAKCISLLLSFDGRHLTHCSKGDIKNKTATKYWQRNLNRNCVSPLSSSFVFYKLCFGTHGAILSSAILFMTSIQYFVLFIIEGI